MCTIIRVSRTIMNNWKNLHSAFEFKFKINTWIEFYSKYLPIILADDIWLTY